MLTRRRELLSPLYTQSPLTGHLLTLTSLTEEEVLKGDIEKLISPYGTANLWVSNNNTLL